MVIQPQRPVISVMLAVADTPTAVAWYTHALGATLLWSLGAVAGLEIAGAPFFLGEPADNGWESPATLGITSTRVEVFCDDLDTMIVRVLEAGAAGNLDDIKDHDAPWGTHRQGHFTYPFGHIWLVGDRLPLSRYPQSIRPVCPPRYTGRGIPLTAQQALQPTACGARDTADVSAEVRYRLSSRPSQTALITLKPPKHRMVSRVTFHNVRL